MSRHELEWLTELWRMEPSSAELDRLYHEARAAVRHCHTPEPGILGNQVWFRRISAEYARRLAAAGVYVEGETS